MKENLSSSPHQEIAQKVLEFRKKETLHRARLQVFHALDRAKQAGQDVLTITPDDPLLTEVRSFWKDNAVIIVERIRPGDYGSACFQAKQAGKQEPSELEFCEEKVSDIFANFVKQARTLDPKEQIRLKERTLRDWRDDRAREVRATAALTKPKILRKISST